MKRKRFSEEQIIGILTEGLAGIPATELCRKHGVGESTYYKWKLFSIEGKMAKSR